MLSFFAQESPLPVPGPWEEGLVVVLLFVVLTLIIHRERSEASRIAGVQAVVAMLREELTREQEENQRLHEHVQHCESELHDVTRRLVAIEGRLGWEGRLGYDDFEDQE